MKYVGAHVSIAGGVEQAPLNAAEIGASAFAMFAKNQRQWDAPPYTRQNIDRFRRNMATLGFTPEQVLVHDGYLINLANPDPEARARSVDALLDEVRRCAQLGLARLNLHPGSRCGKGTVADGIRWIAEGINRVLSQTQDVTAVIENTAGQGSNLGSTLEELRAMIEQVEDKTRIGFCLDTCHLHAAGFNIATRDGYAKVMKAVDRILGLKYLRGMHLNDAKSSFNSHVDRHESLGKGTLGIEVFRCIMNDPCMENLPLILETPDETIWSEEIKNLHSLEHALAGKKKTRRE